MVNIDTVYQRVLALANKEQRGYITPQEFNLFANQAQMDIFEQYFYDLNQFRRLPGNDTVYSDMVNILEDKIDIFRSTWGSGFISTLTASGAGYTLPTGIYRMEQVRMGGTQCEKLTARQYNEVRESPLTVPTPSRPIYTIRGGDTILINDGTYVDFTTSKINIFYIRKPSPAKWTYVVVGEKALSNPDPAVGYMDFELHPSEEVNLVIKILGLAGITLKETTKVSCV
jgi:hypothetical protein